MIGTDADGASDTLERNLISGNVQAGVRIEGDNSDSNAVAGNYIGTNASGNAALANNIGVRVDDQAAQTIIGPSTNPDLGNVISGNSGDGIFIGDNCDTTVVQYNVIGRNYLASAALGNNRNGIYLTAGAFDSNIYANTIASNSGAGIFMASSAGVGNYYENNRIYDNGGLGVDLAPIGVTPNDLGDGDIGPNNLMNFPEFRLLVIHDDEILIEGVINSEPNETIPILVYQVQSCDPSGYGEGGGSVGDHYTTGTSATTDANGNGVFVSAAGGYDPSIPYIVMSTGYSEFSECKRVEAATSANMAELSIGDASLVEGDSGSTWMEFDITLDRAATITVTLSYGLVESSAKFGEDFVQDWGEISFPPGATEQTLRVEILGDSIAEPDEIFMVNIHTPVGALIQDSQATGTIWDDDGGGGSWLFLPLLIR